MFERFTNKARHVVVLAQEEARLLNHNYIGTEHVLLGLLGEPESIAGAVLESFGITRDGAREEVEAKIGRGQKQQTGHIPFTPRAKKVLELSLREALQIKHTYIGTEHILLGLIREGDGVAAQILREHADLDQIRAAVLDAVSAIDPSETAEGEETNPALRWLRQRLRRHVPSVPLRPEALGPEPTTRGTPAVEAALQQAARLAGPRPVGSHHLLLAALEDANSAASWALASQGVDLDELREKLRSANITGTSDERPEQAGRRQMAIEVSDEMLTVVLTDPVIVEAGKEALRAVHARAAAAAKSAAKAAEPSGEAPPEEVAGEGLPDAEQPTNWSARYKANLEKLASGDVNKVAEVVGDLEERRDTEHGLSAAEKRMLAKAKQILVSDTGDESVATSVIRGDHPLAAGLTDVWLELHRTLTTLTDPTRHRRVKIAVKPPEEPGQEDPGEGTEPGAVAT